MSHNDGCILFFLNLNNLIAGSKPARENGSQYLLLMPRIIYSKYSMLLLMCLTDLLLRLIAFLMLLLVSPLANRHSMSN